MGSKLDRMLWNAVWKAPDKLSLTPAGFLEHLLAGASPWVFYVDNNGKKKTLLEGICRSTHCDFVPMLSTWIKFAGPIEKAPKDHPHPLWCLPVNASFECVDKLVAAGFDPLSTDAAGRNAFSALIERGIQDTHGDVMEHEGFWWVAEALLKHIPRGFIDLSLEGALNSREVFGLLTRDGARLLPERATRLMLEAGHWDLSWHEDSHYGKCVRQWSLLQMNHESPPHLFSREGFDWLACDSQKNTFAHWLVMSPHHSYDGKMILPVAALQEAVGNGLSLLENNAQGWNVMQRIASCKWANEPDLAPLIASVRSNKLQSSTPQTMGSPSLRRI